MKTTAAACLAAALWVAAATASHAAEQGAVDAKDKTNSWVGWAYHKFTQTMGDKASQGKYVAQETSDEAGTAQGRASDKEKASNVQDGMNDAMHKASDKLESAYESAKEEAGMAAGDHDMSRHVKEGYEAAKERASRAAGDMGEKMREGKSEL